MTDAIVDCFQHIGPQFSSGLLNILHLCKMVVYFFSCELFAYLVFGLFPLKRILLKSYWLVSQFQCTIIYSGKKSDSVVQIAPQDSNQ